MDFTLFMKFILFYFEVVKRIISRQIDLNNSILCFILSHYDN